MPPDHRAVRAFLDRVSRRLTARAAAEGAAAGLLPCVLVGLAGWPRSSGGAALLALVGLIIGTLIRILLTAPTRRAVATYVERQAPQSRNLVATAAELTASEDTLVRSMVVQRAARFVEALNPAALVPLRVPMAGLLAVALLFAFELSRAGAPILSRESVRSLAAPSGPSISGVDFEIVPPAYTGRASSRSSDPSRIEALAGSRLTIRVRGRADRMALETLSSRDTLRGTSPFVTSIGVASDGYLAIQPLAGEKAGARRLIGITALVDAAPRVKITSPGRDIILRDAAATLDVEMEADDDIALASLSLRYTKVSGSGERFTFAEGTVPITISRTDIRRWKATAHWSLKPLELGPGDMVVYRAIATDARPGAPGIESDAFIAELPAPGMQAAPGFSLDPEQERYAVSQQMVIVKTERLLAKRATMSAEDFATEAAELAIEQRKVRAEFVFMLGGELADAPDAGASITDLNETAEAEGEADLLAGRNANAGHIALLRAIRSMSRAASSLATAEVDAALPHERIALTSLESAFSRARIILRALTTRERLDPTRRLSGVLADAAREARPVAAPVANPKLDAMRRALADMATLTTRNGANRALGDSAALVAERLLRVDPSSNALQSVASSLAAGAREANNGRLTEARRAFDTAATALAGAMRSMLPRSEQRVESLDDALMRGALSDRLRGSIRP